MPWATYLQHINRRLCFISRWDGRPSGRRAALAPHLHAGHDAAQEGLCARAQRRALARAAGAGGGRAGRAGVHIHGVRAVRRGGGGAGSGRGRRRCRLGQQPGRQYRAAPAGQGRGGPSEECTAAPESSQQGRRCAALNCGSDGVLRHARTQKRFRLCSDASAGHKRQRLSQVRASAHSRGVAPLLARRGSRPGPALGRMLPHGLARLSGERGQLGQHRGLEAAHRGGRRRTHGYGARGRQLRRALCQQLQAPHDRRGRRAWQRPASLDISTHRAGTRESSHSCILYRARVCSGAPAGTGAATSSSSGPRPGLGFGAGVIPSDAPSGAGAAPAPPPPPPPACSSPCTP